MPMQTFQYKHYDKDHNFVQVINPKIITNDISFSAQINWGQGSLFIQLKLDFKDNNFNYGDIIKINVVNEYNPTGFLVYTGFIQNINERFDNYEQVELEVYGLASLLKDVVYKDGTSFDFTKTGKAL